MMKSKLLFPAETILLSLSVVACNSVKEEAKKDNPPNIVLILADDMGYGELSCYGQKNFTTPNIDHLASEGMRFTDFYAGNTVSGPSRCSLITGKHPGNASVRGNQGMQEKEDAIYFDRVGVTRNDSTIGEILQKAGYKTALCGKWHLEHYDDSLETWPKYRGFDYVIRERWNTNLNKARKAYREKTGIIFDYNYPYELWENGKKVNFDGNINGEQRHLMDDIVTEKGLKFIEENKNDPFFVFFSLKIPHNPETFGADSGQYQENDWPECERIHAVRIQHLDNIVKQIVSSIDEMGLGENTLILFSSDNGGHSEGGYLEIEVDPCKHDYTFFESNAPLKGYKRDLYDGGIRVPLIARWTGKIKPGTTSNHIGAFWDFMATFADMGGIEIPEYKHDGISFLPEMLEQKQAKHDHLYFEFMNGDIGNEKTNGFIQSIRKDNYKAVRYGVNSKIEIYDLTTDIGEANDISSERPELVEEMSSLFESSRTEHAQFPYGGSFTLDMTKERKWVSP